MSNPDTGLGRRISRIPRSRWWRAWRRAARVGLVTVLAGAFAGAAQAQDKLDKAVDELAELLVSKADLEGEAVLVRPSDFFEMGTERSLPLSKYLAWRFSTALGHHRARPVSGTEDDSYAITLQGRWQRESGGSLLLSVEVKRLAGDGLNERSILDSRQKRVPLADIDGKYLRADLESHGRDVVRQLWRGVAMNAPVDGRRYRLHLQPFEVGSETLLPEWIGEDLLDAWLPAFTRSGRFAVFLDGSAEQSDGELRGTVRDRGGHIRVNLKIHSRQNQLVASTNVGLAKELFTESEEVTGEPSAVGRCAGLAGAGRSAEAVKCYAGVLKEVAGNAQALEGLEGLRGTKFQDCEECPEMVVVPEGSFMMGSTSGSDAERPVHEVTIARPFAVGVYEVMFAEWDACVSDGGCGGYRPDDAGWGHGRRPVIHVSWENAKAYVRWLSRKTGEAYRLLSESEWEYVARAGTTTRYWWGNEIGRSRANCGRCGSRWDAERTAPVGSFSPNAFGLQDVHGNVWEWVEDCWNDSYNGAPSDGSAWTSGECDVRVLRGGSWDLRPGYLRSAYRIRSTTGSRGNSLGFRVARTLTP